MELSAAVIGSCPICGMQSVFEPYLTWNGHFWVRCRSCGGGHKDPYIGEIENPELMAKNYDNVYLEPAFFERRKFFAKNQAVWLISAFHRGMSVLEVGPGLGLAAEAFLELQPDVSYHVVEPYTFFVKQLKQRLGDRVTIHASLEEALRQLNGPVLVYLDNVLEHLVNPREIFVFLKTILPPRSKVLIDVPNERGLKWRARLYRAIGAVPTVASAHINLFTSRSLRAMVSGLGVSCTVRQRGIRRLEEVNCIPEGPFLSSLLRILRVLPVDCWLGLANNLRAEIVF
jgi:SAM-dependent methyltransferase